MYFINYLFGLLPGESCFLSKPGNVLLVCEILHEWVKSCWCACTVAFKLSVSRTVKTSKDSPWNRNLVSFDFTCTTQFGSLALVHTRGKKVPSLGPIPTHGVFFFVCLFFCKDLEKQRLLCRGKITFWNRLTSSFGKVQFIYENSLRWNVVLLTYLNSCAEQCPWFYFAAMLQKMSMLTQCSMSLLQHYVPVVKYCIAQHGNLCQGFYFSNGSCFSKGEIKKRSMYPTVIIATE